MNDYIGKHRPKTEDDKAAAAYGLMIRDTSARVFGNTYTPRHSAAHRPERAA